MNMKQNKKKHLWTGIWFLLTFLLWTALIRCVAVLNDGATYGGDPIEAFWETPWLDGASTLTVKQTVEAVLTGTGGPVRVYVLGEAREGESVSELTGENLPTEFLLRSVGRRLKLRIENVNGSDFDISGGVELLFDEQRRVL